VVPFLKVDKGLAGEEHGVQLMKPIPDLTSLLERAAEKGVFGTKMRSVIADADRVGISAAVKQQFDVGRQILAHGLLPIIEPEVSVRSPTKIEAEAILREAILLELDTLPPGKKVMIKLTIPTIPDFYQPLVEHGAVVRLVALSGGYTRADACEKLSHNHGMIASFSRALTEDLRAAMTETEFDNMLGLTVGEIFRASVSKSAIAS
jgi:fructose-bisphosphate aldolase class I